jgi:DNA-binding response OmpR family regulator
MADKKKILVVDDEDALRRALSDSLKAEGDFEVSEAPDGEAALEIIRKDQPDLVLLDISMPKMDGISVARRMSEGNMLGKTKIIFLTNATDINQIATAVEAGSSDYLIKADWDMKDIIARIREKITD